MRPIFFDQKIARSLCQNDCEKEDVPFNLVRMYCSIAHQIFKDGGHGAKSAPLPTLRIRVTFLRVASFPDLPTFRELGYEDVEFYLDAPEFAEFVAEDSARLIAAVKKIRKVQQVERRFLLLLSPREAVERGERLHRAIGSRAGA